jgi:ribosomal protein L37AE/L43A
VAEIIATDEETPLCPQCERSDMVRLYYEHYCCERCCVWLQGSVELAKRRRLLVPVGEIIATNEAAPLCPSCGKNDLLYRYTLSPRQEGVTEVAYWCDRCAGWRFDWCFPDWKAALVPLEDVHE